MGPMRLMMEEKLIVAHGGYRTLKFYQATELIYDLTFVFCAKFVRDHRLCDQMIHAARSGRQNIAEGCQASGTSKKTELKLVNVARASLEELLLDFEDYLRQHKLIVWGKEHAQATKVRALAYVENRSYTTYRSYCETPEGTANTAICLIHQANYLLDNQLRALEKQFLTEGGFTERLYTMRRKVRD